MSLVLFQGKREDIINEIMKNNRLIILAPSKILDDYEIILMVVKQNGSLLEYASKRLKIIMK